MDKKKRIFAWTGIILLVLMYLSTLIFALMKSDAAYDLFRASVACTILIPVILYACLLVYRLSNKNKDYTTDDNHNKKPDGPN